MRAARPLLLGFGSNLGDREGALSLARHALAKRIGPMKACSSIFETAAWGDTDQSDFLNQVVCYTTRLHPFEILKQILRQELRMGRERLQKWGARTIDIDLLFYQDLIINDSRLTVPHPFISDRKFILAPLAEITPQFKHPITGFTMTDMLANCTDPSHVNLYKA